MRYKRNAYKYTEVNETDRERAIIDYVLISRIFRGRLKDLNLLRRKQEVCLNIIWRKELKTSFWEE